MVESAKIENKYGHPLELFMQEADDKEMLVTLRSNSGPASIYFWFAAEQALALAAQLTNLAVQCKDGSSQNT